MNARGERSDSSRSTPALAVALRYARAHASAPQVVASGRGEIAERILAFARASGVPVREDSDLVELLSACDVGETIPVELFEAVARLLTALYRMNDELVRAERTAT
jgi:flagellar biosynthesis protein